MLLPERDTSRSAPVPEPSPLLTPGGGELHGDQRGLGTRPAERPDRHARDADASRNKTVNAYPGQHEQQALCSVAVDPG